MSQNTFLNQVIVWSEDKKVISSSKARIDIVHICKDKGFSFVDVEFKKNTFAPLRAWFKLVAFMRSVRKIKNGDMVWLDFPTYFSVITFFLLSKRLHKKHCTLCFVVHDIESIRYGRDIKEDIRYLNLADKIIAHTENMKQLLQTNGCTKEIETMGLFPYIASDEYESQSNMLENKNMVAFAGNLTKGDFIPLLSKMHFSYTNFRFYGLKSNLTFDKTKGMEYMGKFYPDNVSAINAGWGLVWDGVSTETCSGWLGEYLKYNSPHKLSLYIAAGIPVIVWEQSAFASFVNEKNIGITICALKEIDDKLKAISPEAYSLMLQNVRVQSAKLRKGGTFADIIDKYASKKV
jgi:hypothetical protein